MLIQIPAAGDQLGNYLHMGPLDTLNPHNPLAMLQPNLVRTSIAQDKWGLDVEDLLFFRQQHKELEIGQYRSKALRHWHTAEITIP